MSLVIRERERERERERDRDREWEDGSSYRSSVGRGSPPHDTFRTVRRYRVNRPTEEADSLEFERDRHVFRTGGSSDSTISHRNSDRDLRDRPYETERRIEIDRRVERERLRPFERDFERDRPIERESRTIEIDRQREIGRPLPYELERYTRSAEYFAKPEPPLQPIIIRQQAAPQQIIIQEVPRDPIVIRREVEPSYEVIRREEIETTEKEVARRPRRREEHYEEYEYERESKSVDRPHRGRDRDEEYYSEHDEYRRHSVSPRESASNHGRDERYSDDDLVIVKEEEYYDDGDHHHHHRRHLAEGAVAGLGAAALLSHHQKRQGEEVDHRGRKFVGSAAVGALAAEGISRVRSRSRHSRKEKSRHRSRSSSHHRAKDLAKLGLGAAAVAAAVKFASDRYQENKNSEEPRRSRSRRRQDSMSGGTGDFNEYDSDGEPRASKHTSEKHRRSRIGQAALGSAAAVGVLEAVKNKVEERRTGRSRSRSRLRQGLPIAAAALGGASIAGIYENQQKKKEERGMERDDRRRSRSRSRSMGAYPLDPNRIRGPSVPVGAGTGLIEYGDQPVHTAGAAVDAYGRPRRFDSGENLQAAAVAGAAAGAASGAAVGTSRERHRSHSRRRGYDGDGYDSASDDGRSGRYGKHRRHASKSRSRSRSRGVRGLAEAGLAAGAAGLAATHLTKKRERKNAERKQKEEKQHRYDTIEQYSPAAYNEQYSPLPTGASVDNQYPKNLQFPPPPVPGYDVPPYNPQDYPAPPHTQSTQPFPQAAADPYGYNAPHPNTNPLDPYNTPGPGARGEERTADNVSARGIDDEDRVNGRRRHGPSSTLAPSKSVMFNVDGDRKPRGKQHRRRRTSDAGLDPAVNQSTTSLPERKHRPKTRSRPRSVSPLHSEDTMVLPDRFDSDGRPKRGATGPGDGARLEDRLEEILNGKRASNFFKKIFNDSGEAGVGPSRR